MITTFIIFHWPWHHHWDWTKGIFIGVVLKCTKCVTSGSLMETERGESSSTAIVKPFELIHSWKWLIWVQFYPESEKACQRVSNADRKVFANPESFCNKLIICWRISGYFGKCPDTIQNIHIICKVGMNWKFSIWCKKCPDNLKNVSGYSKKSLDNVKMYLENLEGSGWS